MPNLELKKSCFTFGTCYFSHFGNVSRSKEKCFHNNLKMSFKYSFFKTIHFKCGMYYAP